jgi:hypothetical protein
MSRHPHAVYQVPEATRWVARAAFPHGTLWLHIADALGPIDEDQQFADLFPRRGQPAEAPAGTASWSPTRRASRASRGSRIPTRSMGWSGKCALRARPAHGVAIARSAPQRRRRRACWGSRRACTTRLCKPGGNGRRSKPSASSTPPERGLKPPTNQPSGGVAYGGVATSDSRNPICSLSSPPPRSTSCGSQRGEW